jgi:cytochrome c2
VIAWIAAAMVTACSKAPPAEPMIAGNAERGAELVEKFECQRCHDGTGVRPIADDKHCVHCHQSIEKRTYAAPAEALDKWNASITHVREVPSLATARQRLRRNWVASFVRNPHDLRPALTESMPRLAMTEAEARDIAAFLVPTETRADSLYDSDATEGKRIFEAKGCATCHRFTGAGTLAAGPLPPGVDLGRGVRYAPDLRHARARLQTGTLVKWIRTPEAIEPKTAMPNLGLTDREARAVAAFVLTTPLAEPVKEAVPPRLPVLDRPVSYQEVSTKVFRQTCWHCHADPSVVLGALGDAGPGNTGGFGFEPRGINVADYEGLAAGHRDAEGKRRSLFKPGPDGVPLLVAALYARQSEEAGVPVPGIRGMPLALPALSSEDIQLVATWVAQGRPRVAVTGRK